jgi:hypothetical protein
MEKAEELKNLKPLRKGFLILLKYIPHSIALVYILYTII